MATSQSNFNEAMAEAWRNEVNGEFEAVNKILAEVQEEVQTQPYEDDTILTGFHDAGVKLKETWDTLAQQFDMTIKAFDTIKKIFHNIIQQSVDSVDDYKKNVRI